MGTALEEFARTRGVEVLGGQMLGRQWQGPLAVGGVFLTAGLVLLALAASSSAPSSALGFQVMGLTMLLPTVLCLSTGVWLLRKAGEYEIAPTFSHEATALLFSLVPRIDDGMRKHGHVSRTVRKFDEYASTFGTPCLPSPSDLETLERAATAHNRVMATVGRGKDARTAKLRSAADAGMGEALHLVASQRGGASEMTATVARMEELADLVVQSNARSESISVLRSHLESAVEELRAEAEAARELRS